MPDRAAALARVAALRAEHPSATHVCWALVADGHSAAHDDGEPGGTAGRPMLEVLRHQDLEGVLATVVRYYGGTPLGAGGLVRAYTDSVAGHAQSREGGGDSHHNAALRVALRAGGWLRRELDGHGATLLEALHGEGVTVTLQLPEAHAEALTARINDAGQGKVVWVKDPSSDGA